MAPATVAAAPLGIADIELGTAATAGAIWFLCSFLSTSIYILTARSVSPLLIACGPVARAEGIFGAATLTSGLLAATSLGLCKLLDPTAAVPVTAGLLCAAHFAAVGVWVDRLPLPATLRWLTLALVAWVLPAFLTSDSAFASSVRWVLGPAGHATASLDTVGQVSLAVLPIGVWLAAAGCVSPRRESAA